jgi:hypothetical protein
LRIQLDVSGDDASINPNGTSVSILYLAP